MTQLEALGAVPGDGRLAVAITRSWAGLVRGELTLTRPDAATTTRSIEDDRCEDVLDALAIAAALALRTAPARDSDPNPEPDPEREPEPDPEPDPDPPEPPPAVSRIAIGAALRLGLGPVPGLAPAPDVSFSLELDRFVLGVHVLGWPEASAPEGNAPGVALAAVGGTLELGVRMGGDVFVVPAAVLELHAVIARGIGVPSPRSEVVLAADAGVSATLCVPIGPIRLLARADAVVPAARPSYVVGETVAFETPVVRGTGMLGIAWVFDLGGAR